jgi:DNA-directed RNA polymerase
MEACLSKLQDLAVDLSVERFNRRDKQIADTLGHEATGRGRTVADECLPGLINYLKAYHPHGGPRARLWDILVRAEPDRLAAAILSGAINTIGRLGDDDDGDDNNDATLRATMEQIGTNLERECRSARLLKKNAKGYARLDWDVEQLHNAGGWGVDVLMKALPGMFELVLDGPDVKERDYYLQLSARAQDIADETLWACVRNNPHHMPTLEPPPPWTSECRNGQWGERQLLVKCRPNSLRMDAVKKAFAQKSRPWLDAIHKLESVAYRINEPILRFVQRSYELATSDNPHGLDFLFHGDTIRAWRWDLEENKRRSVIVANAGGRNKGSERTFRMDRVTAEELLNRAFYVPMNFDTRGRLNVLPIFNFTRGDHIRCLFEFDEGKPIGERGLYWLKVHVANCAAGFKDGKPGNLTFDQRAQWVNDHLDELTNIGRAALENAEVDEALLSGVDDRFQFVRGCIELYRANGSPEFISHLPLLFDATASGLQHYCLMTRDEVGGREVNLVPQLSPQDVYQKIANRLSEPNLVLGYKEARHGVKVAVHVDPAVHALLAVHPKRRRLVKGVMVPRIYSGRDIRETLLQEPWFKKRPRVWVMTPYGNMRMRGSKALKDAELEQAKRAGKAAGQCFDAIEAAAKQLLPGPFAAMDFLYKVARLLAEEDKSLNWPSPTKFPWQSRYHKPKTKRIKSWIGGKAVRTTITVGDLPEVRSTKAKNAGAPNLVHGLDAAHLQLVALWAGDIKIPLVTVHDCFGCLAADAEQFRTMVHDRLAQMYLHHPDVLGEVLESARRDLSPAGRAKLPALPEYGTLNIEDVRNAQYITA